MDRSLQLVEKMFETVVLLCARDGVPAGPKRRSGGRIREGTEPSASLIPNGRMSGVRRSCSTRPRLLGTDADVALDFGCILGHQIIQVCRLECFAFNIEVAREGGLRG